jgi:hypothetical protein
MITYSIPLFIFGWIHTGASSPIDSHCLVPILAEEELILGFAVMYAFDDLRSH